MSVKRGKHTPPYVAMIRSLVQDVIQGGDVLISPCLTNRMVCCAMLLEKSGDKIIKGQYPQGSSWSMRHPCDSFLRSLLGHSHIMDLRMVSTHDQLSKGCLGLREKRVDPLTMLITSRRYNCVNGTEEYAPDRKPTFMGAIPQESDEALVYAMYGGGGKAATSVDYNALSIKIVPMMSLTPCKWFPGKQDLAVVVNKAYWLNVENGVHCGLYGLAESSVVIIRFNFTTVFDPKEQLLCKTMLHPSWCNGGATDQQKLHGFAHACKEFMTGPVLICAKRLGAGVEVGDMWSDAEEVLSDCMRTGEAECVGSAIVRVLQCMELCSAMVKSLSDLQRQVSMRALMDQRGGAGSAMRHLLFLRASKNIKVKFPLSV